MRKTNRNLALVLTLGASLGIMACAAKNGNPDINNAATANVINSVYTSLQTAAPDFSTTTTSSLAEIESYYPYGSVGSNLNLTNSFPATDGGASNVKTPFQYLEGQFGSSAQNSIFKRAKTPFLVSCTIDALASRSGTLYSTSTTSMTMTSALIGVCGSAADYIGGSGSTMIGSTVTATIADLANTTNFDQLITMPGASNPLFGGADQYIYIRNNSTTLNILHVELTTSSGSFSVNALSYNKTAGSGSYQYVTGSTSRAYEAIYRIYLDSTNNVSRVFTYSAMSSAFQTTTISAGSTYSTQTAAALSMSWTGMSSHTSTSLTDGNACLALSTSPPTITTDNTLTCNGQTISAASGGASLITAHGALSQANIRTWAENATLGAAKFPTFNSSTILTASLGL